jgi:membrane protein YdbS with pleckstrin-like domain
MAVLPQRWEWSKRPIQELPNEVTKYLAETELEALGGQVHEAVMIEPIATTTLGVIACLWLTVYLPADLTWLAHVLYVVILVFIGRLVVLAFEWRFNLIFITNKRIIYVHGLITRRVEMMPLSKLTDMSYIRTPLGTVLGYGTFRVESAGQDQALSRLSPIPDPDNSYRYVQNLLFGRATTDVRLVDVTTDRKVSVRWSGRTRRTSSGDFVVEQDDEPNDKFW